MGPSQTTEAIILRTRAYAESDKIVTFLSDDAGKLTGIAKGAKNSRRRFANCLDPFTRVRVHFRTRPGASLVFMDSCDLLRPPGALVDPAKFAYGSYLVELVDQLTAEAHPVRELYRLLAEGLTIIEHSVATAPFLRAFEMRLLHDAGYDPQLQRCGHCQRAVAESGSTVLDPLQGHVLCNGCCSPGQSGVTLSGDTLAAVNALRMVPLVEAQQRRFAPPVAAEAARLMSALLALHLPRPLRSLKLIAALRC